MDNILLYPSKETMIIDLVNLSVNTLKGEFSYLEGKVEDLPNHRRTTVGMDIIKRLKA